ncbi:MAG: cytochrome c oxidase assembly protein [Thiomonas sp.]
MDALLRWFIPWELSPTALALLAVAAVLYVRGCRRHRPSLSRQIRFWLGWVLMWQAFQTRWDYYAEHQFFVHILQQLSLHDFAPLLLMWSYPLSTLRAGIPLTWRLRWLRPMNRSAVMRGIKMVLFNPVVAAVLFGGMALLWLIPSFHPFVMLNAPTYRLMNWSMALDGLLFWWLVLDTRPSPPAHLSSGKRVFLPLLAMLPTMAWGAILALSMTDYYPIYEICGRALSLDPLTDQHLGGLILWIPGSFAMVLGSLIALRIWMRLSERGRLPPRNKAVTPTSAATVTRPTV